MLLRLAFVIVFIHLSSPFLRSQVGLISSYSMDGCDLVDDTGNNHGTLIGTMCGCGVNSNGLSFAGNFDTAEFDENLNEVFKGDWTISFYVQILNQGSESVDILFLGQNCGIDSLLSLRYLPSSQRFRFRLSNSPNNSVQLDGLADTNSCWQYIAITKNLANVAMYVNGLLVDQGAATSDLLLDVAGKLSISNSPCQNVNPNPDVKFQGIIDEFEVFNRTLSIREIMDNNLNPDKILTRDTTIFIGESIRILTGGTCFQDFSWNPSTALSDPQELHPIASPGEDITYTLTINGDNCLSEDRITIRIADPTSLTCSDLLLPTAFTPNNDRINDKYGISNQFLISQLSSFEIFNKWGGRVFFANNRAATWDGSYQGNPAPPTTYVYKVTYVCEGKIYTKSGALSLIR